MAGVEGGRHLVAAGGQVWDPFWVKFQMATSQESSAQLSPALRHTGTQRPQHPCPGLAGAPGSARTRILLRLFLHFTAPGWCTFLNSSFVTEHHTVARDAGNSPRTGFLAGEVGPKESTGTSPRESLPYVLEVGTASPASQGP